MKNIKIDLIKNKQTFRNKGLMIYETLLVILLFSLPLGIMSQGSNELNSIDSNNFQHKLILSISQPCSLSVAFLRMMRQRGDFLIVHEPGVLAWRILVYQNNINTDEYPFERRTFPELEPFITSLAKKQNVFVKEECYAGMHYLYNGDIIKSPNTYPIFLVRHPHQMLLSIHDKIKLEILKDFADYQSMWKLFERIKSVNLRQPHIIFVQDLVKDPHKIIKQFCDYANIAFKEESLKWENLQHNFKNGNIWYESPYARFDAHWHGNALISTGFLEMKKAYAVDYNGQPTFEEIEDNRLREIYLKFYKEMIPYYELFLAEYSIQQKSYLRKNVEFDKGGK